jgi:lysophospholipase L1-like esterase
VGRRRLLVSAATLASVAIVAEITARIVDARTEFRGTLLAALRAMEASTQPLRESRLELPPDPEVAVRAPATDESSPAAYVIGGRTVEDAHPSVRYRTIAPEEIRRSAARAVFIVGESAGFGFPYAYSQSFAAILDDSLRAKRITVLNASEVGATSADLSPIVQRIVERFEPLALVLMIGNNEWIQWVPPQAAPVSASRIRWMQRLANSAAIAGLEYWTLQRSVAADRASAGSSAGFRPHAEISGHAEALRYPADDAGFDAASWPSQRQEFLAVFEANLERMVRSAKARGVRVILLTLPFNHKLSPAWKHTQPESFDAAHRSETRAAIRSAASYLDAKQYEPALSEVDRALKLDPAPPILHYLRGEALEGLKRPSEAEQAYAQCRENMVGNLGSRLSINASIRRIAAETHADLVDVEQIFEEHEHELGHYFNEDLIRDDCHPTPAGHRLIAEALARLF